MVYLCIILSAFLDIGANIALGYSEGFKKKLWGVGAILLVLLAFSLLSFAVQRGIELSVAYASWGALGVIGTSVGGAIFFGQKFNILGYVGMILVVLAVILLNF